MGQGLIRGPWRGSGRGEALSPCALILRALSREQALLCQPRRRLPAFRGLRVPCSVWRHQLLCGEGQALGWALGGKEESQPPAAYLASHHGTG